MSCRSREGRWKFHRRNARNVRAASALAPSTSPEDRYNCEMGKTTEELMAELAPARRARIEARIAVLIAEAKRFDARAARKSHVAHAQACPTGYARHGPVKP
jgi:uncharacterized small protein (DUF1192 family)